MEGWDQRVRTCLLVYWRCTLGVSGGPCVMTGLRKRQLTLPVVNWDIFFQTALMMWIYRKLCIHKHLLQYCIYYNCYMRLQLHYYSGAYRTDILEKQKFYPLYMNVH